MREQLTQAELDEMYGPMCGPTHHNACACREWYFRDLERELLAEREQFKVDALRYRWLRQQHWDEADIACVVNPKAAVRLGHDCPSLERLDAAVDAAMIPKLTSGDIFPVSAFGEGNE